MLRKYRLVLIVLITVASMVFPAAGNVLLPTARAASYTDWAGFVMDVTVPDGTVLAPSTPFTKTWRLKNIGTATWTTSYSLQYVNGDMLGAPASVNLPSTVAPGQSVDVSVQMVSPASPGHYRGNWMLKNAAGATFGIGSTASNVFWVDINVALPFITAFDFTQNICTDAVWVYSGGPIPCPTRPEKIPYGYVEYVSNPILENGVVAGMPGILTVPQNKYNGVIMGIYNVPQINVGDHFQALIGCQNGAVNCYVSYELHYLTRSNDLITIWKFKEKYDGLFYRVDVDLSRYAFMGKIRLVLVVSAAGYATGDLPLWVAPRIARAVSSDYYGTLTPAPSNPTSTPPGYITPTSTPPGYLTPTSTPPGYITPTATPPGYVTPTLVPASSCDRAQFVQDITIPDGTSIPPGGSFTKTWRLLNASTCIWTPSYSLVFISGDQMDSPISSPLGTTVYPGQTVDISVNLKAPVAAGNYAGYWMLRNTSGGFFGIGSTGDKPFWAKISVLNASLPNVYDFVANLCTASWFSGAGYLGCPMADGNPAGFAIRVDNPVLENGATDSRPAILAGPQAVDYGYIQGIYPPMAVLPGDRFRATLNCQYNATACDVFYRLDYQIDNGPINTFWAIHERYEGLTYNVDLDLASLAGKNVRFILTLLSNGSPSGDRAMWVGPHIYRPGGFGGIGGEAPTSTPIPTSTPLPTETPIVVIDTATSEPSPTPLPTDTETPTLLPTDTPDASLELTPTPTTVP